PARWVEIRFDDSCLSVGHSQRVLDVGERAKEDPEVTIQPAAVQDLDDQLDVAACEEPEVARICRQWNCLTEPALAIEIFPAYVDLESLVVEAQRGRAGNACGIGSRYACHCDHEQESIRRTPTVCHRGPPDGSDH